MKVSRNLRQMIEESENWSQFEARCFTEMRRYERAEKSLILSEVVILLSISAGLLILFINTALGIVMGLMGATILVRFLLIWLVPRAHGRIFKNRLQLISYSIEYIIRWQEISPGELRYDIDNSDLEFKETWISILNEIKEQYQ